MKVKSEVKSLSHVRLLATPRTAAHQGSSIHGIFQARVLEWGAIAFSFNKLDTSYWPKLCYMAIPRVKKKKKKIAWEGKCFIKDTFDSWGSISKEKKKNGY